MCVFKTPKPTPAATPASAPAPSAEQTQVPRIEFAPTGKDDSDATTGTIKRKGRRSLRIDASGSSASSGVNVPT